MSILNKKKLKNVKATLVKLKKTHGNLHNRVQEARQALKSVQTTLEHDPSATALKNEQNACKHLEKCLIKEKALMHQKSRVKWLTLGDGDNSFFHNKIRANRNINKILALQNSNGDMVFGHRNAS